MGASRLNLARWTYASEWEYKKRAKSRYNAAKLADQGEQTICITNPTKAYNLCD